jgi:hypothetical protein
MARELSTEPAAGRVMRDVVDSFARTFDLSTVTTPLSALLETAA